MISSELGHVLISLRPFLSPAPLRDRTLLVYSRPDDLRHLWIGLRQAASRRRASGRRFSAAPQPRLAL